MIALRIRVRRVGDANFLYLRKQRAVDQNCRTQLSPVRPLTARDDIVNRRKRKSLGINMAMKHNAKTQPSSNLDQG